MDVPPAIALAWDRGPGADSCIDGAELAARVEATLGRAVRPVRGDDAVRDSEVLEGSVAPLPSGGWIAVVDVRGANAAGLRREVTLDAPDCRQLDEAIALVVALMADAPLPRPPALVVPIRRAAVTVAVGPDVTIAIGMLPGLATGVGFSSDVAFPRYWHVVAWAHGWPISEALDEGSGARLAAWTFGVAPCLGTSLQDRWSVFGCAGVSAGVVYASGIGLALSRSRSLGYAETELRAGVRLRLGGPFALRLEGGLAVPWTRATYTFTAADGAERPVFRTAAVVPLARLGLEFRAP